MNAQVARATAGVGRRGRATAVVAALGLGLVGAGLVPGPAVAAGPDGPRSDRPVRDGWSTVAPMPAWDDPDVLAGTFPQVRHGHVRGTMRAV